MEGTLYDRVFVGSSRCVPSWYLHMSEYLADVGRGNVIFSHIFFSYSFEFRSSITVTVFIRVGEGEVVWRGVIVIAANLRKNIFSARYA